MAGQKKKSRDDQTDDEIQDLPSSTGSTVDVDDLLDEIDSVLEENAQEFVESYVQKGGQ